MRISGIWLSFGLTAAIFSVMTISRDSSIKLALFSIAFLINFLIYFIREEKLNWQIKKQ